MAIPPRCIARFTCWNDVVFVVWSALTDRNYVVYFQWASISAPMAMIVMLSEYFAPFRSGHGSNRLLSSVLKLDTLCQSPLIRAFMWFNYPLITHLSFGSLCDRGLFVVAPTSCRISPRVLIEPTLYLRRIFGFVLPVVALILS